METETFECSFRKAFEKDNGGVTVYVTKDDGTDMTVYGEAIGTSRWNKGARLKIEALPVRTSKTGKQYQTANSIELLDADGEVVSGTVTSPTPAKDVPSQWKEKYRLTASNLCAAALQSGKEVDFKFIDGLVRQILDAKEKSSEELEDAPF